MSNRQMWESRGREQDGHTPDGVAPHPMVGEPLRRALQWLAPGVAVAGLDRSRPDIRHGLPPSVPRESLTEYRELLEHLGHDGRRGR